MLFNVIQSVLYCIDYVHIARYLSLSHLYGNAADALHKLFVKIYSVAYTEMF